MSRAPIPPRPRSKQYILVTVFLTTGNAEIVIESYSELNLAMEKGYILRGRPVGSSNEMCWRISAAHIIGYLVEDDPDSYDA